LKGEGQGIGIRDQGTGFVLRTNRFAAVVSHP